MVFTTAVSLIRSKGPDKFWKRRRVFRLTAHFYGKARNCYSIAIRSCHRALAYATKARVLKKLDTTDLWKSRVKAGCDENNISHYAFVEGLDRMGIMLNNKSLADLAIWEPRTFSSLAAIAQQKAVTDEFKIYDHEPTPTGQDLDDQPILRSQLKEKKKE